MFFCGYGGLIDPIVITLIIINGSDPFSSSSFAMGEYNIHLFVTQLLHCRNALENRHKFTFSKVFDTLTSQKDLFDETIMPLLKDFFLGQNCLIFTYGITNSGK